MVRPRGLTKLERTDAGTGSQLSKRSWCKQLGSQEPNTTTNVVGLSDKTINFLRTNDSRVRRGVTKCSSSHLPRNFAEVIDRHLLELTLFQADRGLPEWQEFKTKEQ